MPAVAAIVTTAHTSLPLPLCQVFDPVHDQKFYLTAAHKERLKAETGERVNRSQPVNQTISRSLWGQSQPSFRSVFVPSRFQEGSKKVPRRFQEGSKKFPRRFHNHINSPPQESNGHSSLHSLIFRTRQLTTHADPRLPVVGWLAGVEAWSFQQYEGEAVFIPAGCPHQVRNLKVELQLRL